MSRRMLVLVATVAMLAAATSAAGAASWESEDIFGQGMGGPTVAADGAKINRGASGVTAQVKMPTPTPGSYAYPDSATWPTSSGDQGHPEAFSLWVFLFFNPEACDGDCDGPDLVNNPDVVAGAFNAGGHLAAGPKLTISGRVNEQNASFGGPNAETISEALSLGFDIASAEVHLAVAPHGGLDPELLPAQIKTPAGNPNFWWMAIYK